MHSSCIRNWSCSSMTYRNYVKETTLENIKPQFVFQTLSLYPSANRQRALNLTLYPVSRQKSRNLTAKSHKAANYRTGPPAETPLPIAQVSIYSRFFLDRYWMYYLFKITWVLVQGCQTGGEKLAADIEFHHFREMNMLELLCCLVKSFHFLANSVLLAV